MVRIIIGTYRLVIVENRVRCSFKPPSCLSTMDRFRSIPTIPSVTKLTDTRTPRQATALVLTLILLVALLLLGLPFLFTQSASLSGTMAFSRRHRLIISCTNADMICVGLAAYADKAWMVAPEPAQPEWQAFSNPSTDFNHAGLGADFLVPSSLPPEASAGQLALSVAGAERMRLISPSADPAAEPPSHSAGDQLQVGATLRDTSGQLDPNSLSSLGWQHLLQACGIADWNDALVYPVPLPGDAVSYRPSSDGLGQLAKSLSLVGGSLPGGHITMLAQLQLADPQRPQGPSGPTWDRLRCHLTTAELLRLAPALQIAPVLPGRHGLIDLGTVIQVDMPSNQLWMDSTPDDCEPLLAPGSRLEAIGAHAGAALPALAIVGAVTGSSASSGTFTLLGQLGMPLSPLLSTGLASAWAVPGGAVMLEAPSPLNIHALTPLVRASFDPLHPLPMPIDGTQLGVISTEACLWSFPGRAHPTDPITDSTLSAWISPIGSGSELPPLGVLSSGTTRLPAAWLWVCG